jgi:hypothetical protein
MDANLMKKNEILSIQPKVLTQEQRLNYFENGYLALEKFVSDDWLKRLNDVTAEFIDESRKMTASDGKFDLEPDHNADNPRLRRLMAPVEQHPVYREFGLEGPLVDIAEDLLGPNVKYHHSKLNFKWSDGGEEVKWHQDVPFWPHSNAAPLTIGLSLSHVDDEMGPLGVLPGSHLGPFYSHYNDNGEWTGALRDEDANKLDFSKAEYLSGPAGSVTIHNSWMIHGSVPNNSPRSRNLLLHTYSAGDSIPLSTLVAAYPHSDKFVRGSMPVKMELEQRPFEMPPDWSGGYTSIFDLQQKELES